MTSVLEKVALVDAADVLLEKAGGKLLTTSLNKALFYLDLRCLLETGAPLTNTTYVALEAGPVVQSYKQTLVGALESRGIAVQMVEGDAKPVVRTKPVDSAQLSEMHVPIAEEVAAWARGKKARELSDYAHQNPGWKVAFARGEGTEINLHLAMQQLLEDEDPWMKQDLTVEERALVDLADSHEPSEW